MRKKTNSVTDYDLIVIGSASGGYICAIRASQLGLKTACIEESSVFGESFYIPSKAGLYSSEVYSQLEAPEAHSERIKALLKKHHVTVIQGRSRLIDSHTVSIFSGSKQQEISGKSIVLATGSSPVPLPFLPFDEKKVFSSIGALSIRSLPKKVVVVGGGTVGTQLASFYAREGSEVTVVEMMPSICTGIDRELTQGLYESLRTQKVQFFLNTQILGAKDRGEKGVELWIRPADGIERSLTSPVVLVAVGKSPRSQDLGLLRLNVDVTGRGTVITDSRFRTSIPNIYAIGDLIEGPRIPHRGCAEAVIVAEIIAGQDPKLNYMTMPNVIYTTPEVATVGLTEEQAKGQKLLVGRCVFHEGRKGPHSQHVEGLVKVVADAGTGRILGLHILANHASEMISAGAIAIAKKVTLAELGDFPFPSFTYSEAIKEACLQACKRGFHA